MKIPIDWLKDFIEIKKSSQEIEEILTLKGLEIAEIYSGLTGDVLEIELTPNRGDCASLIGVAREIAAAERKKYKFPESQENITNEGEHCGALKKTPHTQSFFSGAFLSHLKVDTCNSPIYYLKHINVQIKPSPDWMQKRLTDCGIRPLNNVVDITNYVMLELGQPLHAFDAALIKGNTIIVRDGIEGENIITLDGKTRKITSKDIIIADKEKAIAIGGIMGAANSSVTEKTKDVLLESAFFLPETIAFTSRRLSLDTEASYRFSRHIDTGSVQTALNRAVSLIAEICSAKSSSKTLVHCNFNFQKRIIEISIKKINKILGTDLNIESATEYLKLLEFEVLIKSDDIFQATVPSYRNDITRDIDLIEEIARMHGYDNIKETLPEIKMIEARIEPDIFFGTENILRALGYFDTITHTLINSEIVKAATIKSEESPLPLANPINIRMDVLRTNLFYGLLDVAAYNINQNQKNIKFYERGKVFCRMSAADSNNESFHIAFISLVENPLPTDDFFEAKKIITAILKNLRQEYEYDYSGASTGSGHSTFFDKNKSAVIQICNGSGHSTFAGEFGCFNKDFLKLFNLKEKKFIGGYLLLNSINEKNLYNQFTKWSIYPSVFRDISLVAPIETTHLQIYNKIKENGGIGGKSAPSNGILKNIQLYDTFSDEKLGKNKKNLTYTLEFNSSERTLISEEVKKSFDDIVLALKSIGVTLRDK